MPAGSSRPGFRPCAVDATARACTCRAGLAGHRRAEPRESCIGAEVGRPGRGRRPVRCRWSPRLNRRRRVAPVRSASTRLVCTAGPWPTALHDGSHAARIAWQRGRVSRLLRCARRTRWRTRVAQRAAARATIVHRRADRWARPAAPARSPPTTCAAQQFGKPDRVQPGHIQHRAGDPGAEITAELRASTDAPHRGSAFDADASAWSTPARGQAAGACTAIVARHAE